MTSVIIAAHNEGAVIGRCLDSLLAGSHEGEFEVVVVPNGCTDSTASIARSHGVRVVESERASKAVALNLGDDLATSYPRIYLDADIVASPAHVRALVQAVSNQQATTAPPRRGTNVLAAVPRRELALADRPWAVRAYFAINTRLPAFRDGLFGRGMIALSEAGRARFERFPDAVADDLFLDSLFSPDEKQCVAEVATTVEAPRHTRDLLNRLRRVRRGNTAMRAAVATSQLDVAVRRADRTAWLRDVVLQDPRLLAAGLVYAAITLTAAILAKLSPRDDLTWQRDESTRSGASLNGEGAQ